MTNFSYALNTTAEFSRGSSMPSVGGYDFYTGSAEDSGFQTTLDFHTDINGTTYTDDFRQTTFLDNTPYVKPSTVNAQSTSSSRSTFVAPVPYIIGSGLFGLLLMLVPLHLL
jgi:hypothetical protein